MKKPIAALFLALSLAPALAQVPPPVPALPDAERRTSYSISASTCACNVNFALYGDSTNIDAWIEVWVAGTRYLSTDTAHGWSLSSATGPLATIPRPITNAVLTFNAAQTGTVQIVGARRPIRASQFNENQGVPARNLNQVLTDIVAQNRETWDRTNDVTGRALLTKPGDTIGQLPVAADRASTVFGFDPAGNPQVLNPNIGLGTVIGPPSAVDGHVAVFDGISGQKIKDAGAGIGTVLSVGLSLPNIFNVTGSPVTSTGTLTAALATQSANSVWAGPATGAAAAPTFRALVGADLPLPGASSLGGIFSKAAVTSNWLRSLGTDGNLTASQPTFNDIAGTISPSQLPNPTASTLGGVQSYVAVPNQWINSISTAGVPSSTQPAFSNLSGSVAAGQMPALTGDVTSSAGAVATTIAANAVTNAKSAQMDAATIKGNPTASTANSQDFTIQGLTARGSPDATNDKLMIFDNASGTFKWVTPNQIATSATAGVSSLNGLSGALSISAGNGISVSAGGGLVTVSAVAPVSQPQGRLTLTSGTAITTSDVTAAGSIYFTPSGGNTISIYNGSSFALSTFTERTLTLNNPNHVSGSNYDVWGALDPGDGVTFIIGTGPAWSTDTTRGTGAGTTEYTMISGMPVNNVSITLRNGATTYAVAANRAILLGTIRMTATAQTEDSAAKRFVSNAWNAVERALMVTDTTDSWNYATATWRQARATSANQLDMVFTLPGRALHARTNGLVSSSNATAVAANASAIGINSTTTPSGVYVGVATFSTAPSVNTSGSYDGYPGIGRNFAAWLEIGNTGVSFYGDAGGTVLQSGITGWILGSIKPANDNAENNRSAA